MSENTMMENSNVQQGADAQIEPAEDMLLVQIDAFRDKAKQLQSLIGEKELKVRELENLVYEKQNKINELQDTLAKKQEVADSLVGDMSREVDKMMDSVNASLLDIEKRLESQVSNSEESQEAQNREIKETLGNVGEDLESIKAELSEKVHSENVKVYRNIHDLLRENDKTEEQSKALIKKIKGTKTVAAWALIFGIVDFAGIGAIVTLLLKMIGLF